MVKVIQKENKELYQCEECGFHYADKAWAEKCEAWCREHKSCNIEITAHVTPKKIKKPKKNRLMLSGFSSLDTARFAVASARRALSRYDINGTEISTFLTISVLG
jgi:predicted ATP-dependent serine protease